MTETTIADGGLAALVVDDSAGIGRAVARRLAMKDVRVVLVASSEQPPSAVEDLHAGRITVSEPVDLQDEDSVRDLVHVTVQQLGGLTAVVSLPGKGVDMDVAQTTAREWARVQQQVLTRTFLLAKHTIPHLARSAGSFTALASTAGVRGVASNAAYAAASHGVVGLVKSLAIEQGAAGVRCNVVCPGRTDGPGGVYGVQEVPSAQVAARRFADVEDAAGAVEHLVLAATYTTGNVLVVDGGLNAGYLNAD
jgi:meso-butanediol dehydrogenase / (S,S)-butanediol dehydrogenase / diacetyl reductase